MERTTVIGLVIGAAVVAAGCQQPVPSAGDEPGSIQAGWTDHQRREFDAALQSARDNLYRQLLRLRIAPEVRLVRLVRDRLASVEELRNLAASARIRRVTWLADGRCRVQISLVLIHVAKAVELWDSKGKWRPHSQVLELNRPAVVTAIAESRAD